MYQEHFGLARPPFKITPDTSLFYEGNQRGAALEALVYAIKSGEGIIKVVGEVGSGKTMLCRMLEVRLADEVDVVYIANPSLSPDNILHVIAHELQLDVNNEMSKVDVMQRLQTHLLKKHASNRQVVLFVEEAQSMPIETLEEIRLLSNLETDQNKLLQMVLFGQPELDEKLAMPHIRQLRERITQSFNLSPFPQEDTLQYLNFRLRAVGYKGPDLFNKKTAGTVKHYSSGLTRRINIIADKALLAAYSEGNHTISSSHIKSAAQDSEFKQVSNKKIYLAIGGLVLLLSTLAVGIFIGQQNSTEKSIENMSTGAGINEEAMREVKEKTIIEAVKIDAAKNVIEKNSVSSTFSKARQVSVEEVFVNTSGLTTERLADTQQWLVDAAGEHFSIQLFMAHISDVDRIESFLEEGSETLDFNKIYIYETVINGHNWYNVFYNNFATQGEAIDMLNSLPLSIRASKPYLRRVSILKRENALYH